MKRTSHIFTEKQTNIYADDQIRGYCTRDLRTFHLSVDRPVYLEVGQQE